MNLKYCGPALDYSGYGEANRHDIAALMSVGVDVSVELTRHCLEIADFGMLGAKIQEASLKPLDYKVKILHTTPNIYNRFIEPWKYHIGRVIWETDKLPPDFAEGCRLVDEIWTASEYNKQAILNSGVDKPIYVIPEAIDPAIPQVKPYEIPNKDSFKFYSIFEWTERKNPEALLKAYWLEFQANENVSLVLKTYVDNFGQDKKRELRNIIASLKRKMGLANYPPVYLWLNLMNRNQIYRFHESFDCFVSSHRGEGWGIPQMEAMLLGKPVISTNCGGIHEYLTHKKDALLVDYKLIPLKSNSRNQQWYLPNQNWADIDIKGLRKMLRYAYENQEQVKKIGENAKQTVLNLFSLQPVGLKMLERLKEIEKINP